MANYLKTKEKAQYDEWKRFNDKGLLLTPDVLRFICKTCEYDPLKIGVHFLEILPKVLKDSE